MLKFVVLALLAFDKTTLGAVQPPVKSLGCGETHSDGVGWIVSKIDDDEMSCDASLIHPYVILTSASCILGTPSTKLEVRGMKWDSATKTRSMTNKVRGITTIVNHDNYNAKLGTNDLAVLVLSEPVVLDDYVNTVCLPTSDAIFDRNRCFVSNYTDDLYSEGRRNQKILKHIEFPVVTPSTCLSSIGQISRETNSFILNRNFLCAGGEMEKEGQEASVSGPLICPVEGERGRYVQAGIISASMSNHKRGVPGLYCNVANMRQWIDSVMDGFQFSKSYYTYKPRVHDPSKKLYIITPTYQKPEQMSLLTNLAQTLMFVENMHWLVVENAEHPSQRVSEFLNKTGLQYEHLTAPTPAQYGSDYAYHHVAQMNRGLDWIRSHINKGVFYFAPVDRIYSMELFEEIRKTKKVSMFPLGFGSNWGLSTPILRNGLFEGYFDEYAANRKYRIDLAGFAVNVAFLLQRPNAKIPFEAGYREDGFVKSLEPLGMNEVDFLANQCTRIYVWNTYGTRAVVNAESYKGTNIDELVKQL